MSNNPNLPPIGRGRPLGVPNRATQDARTAIASFVEGNVERLNGWLDAIAQGVPNDIEEGKWHRCPDPDAAFKAFMSVIEYHIPKLQRTEQTGANGERLIPDKIEITLNANTPKAGNS